MGKLKNCMPSIMEIVNNFSGVISFSILDKSTGERIDYNEKKAMATASTMKVFCLACLLQMVDEGKISLDDIVSVDETNYVRGSGVLKELHMGLELTLRDACMLMIIISDNIASNMVIDACGGVDAINRFIRKYGLKKTVINNRLDFSKINVASDLAVSPSEEFLSFLLKVQDEEMLSLEMKREFFNFLAHQQCVDQFPRYMPYNQYAPEVNQPLYMQVYNKTGFMVKVRVDTGYLEKDGKWVVYAIMSDECADLSFLAENEGNVALGKIGKIVYDAMLA